MKEQKEKTIFEVLFENKICFAVNVCFITAKNKSIDENSRDYFIIVLKTDLKDLKKDNFKRSNIFINIYERDLSLAEISEFKSHMDKFIKVQHDSFGRVYELKNNSFKKLFNNLK